MANFATGDILKVFRGLYYHYGVYVGYNQVVHYSGAGDSIFSEISNAQIIKTSLETFANGDEVEVDYSETPIYSGSEVARRAKAQVGKLKGDYNFIFNNCEHFANWCRTGEPISNQSRIVSDTSVPGRIYGEFRKGRTKEKLGQDDTNILSSIAGSILKKLF